MYCMFVNYCVFSVSRCTFEVSVPNQNVLSRVCVNTIMSYYCHGTPDGCHPVILKIEYNQTSLVSTPGDPPNCYSLSEVLTNHIID